MLSLNELARIASAQHISEYGKSYTDALHEYRSLSLSEAIGRAAYWKAKYLKKQRG